MTVVLLAAYSCVQDNTEDLAPIVSGPGYESGSGELRTLQVAMPTPTRTELGSKGEDGKYPVYWCADEGNQDVLSVNGEPTTNIQLVLAAGETRSSVAIFDMPLATSIPYNIVYPYEAGLEVDTQSGMYPVRFSAEQKHTEGTFASGSAPMYAWSDGLHDVQMHHLSSVLRFTVKAAEGQQVDLKYVSVSTDKAEPIAGVFDVYCGSKDANDERTGEITARKSATSTVFYTFENDSFVLTSAPQTFYIVVPKGSYSRFSVNFVAKEGGVCVRTFDATGDKELLGGKVREFPEITFSADSNMLLIGTDADMRTFASEVAAGTFNEKYDGALLINDVTLNADQPLATIEGYTSVFEGRGYTIKGLTAPLFGENVVATISNVNVEGTINETANAKVGLIARSLSVSGDKVGTIFNCSAKGAITYANPNITASKDHKLVNIGGIVGGVYGGQLSLNESDVAVTVNMVGKSNEANEYLPCIGGVAGYICAEAGVAPVVSGNTNLNAVVWNDSSNSAKVRPFIGGVAGYVVAGEFTDNVNAATLTVAKKMYDLDWGGVLGAANVTVSRCKNEGTLEIAQELTTGHIGGVLGRLEKSENADAPSSLLDCDNYGKLLLQKGFYIKQSCNIGGAVAYAEEGTQSVQNCDNYGEIVYDGKVFSNSRNNSNGNGNASMRLGGVVGLCCSELLYNCNNMESGNLEIAGEVAGVISASDSKLHSSIAGVVGSRCGKSADANKKYRTEKCSNNGTVHCSYKFCSAPLIATSACIGLLDSDEVVDCHNLESGDFIYESSVAHTSSESNDTSRTVIYVAGLISYLYSDCWNIDSCTNSGKVVYDNAKALVVYASGILGYAYNYSSATLTNCGNKGEISVAEGVDCERLHLGGIAASTGSYTNFSFSNCYNSGNVTTKVTTNQYSDSSRNTPYIRIGGLFGQSVSSNPSDKAQASTGVYNNGNVICQGISKDILVGGYCAHYTDENHTIQFTNSGRVEFSPKEQSDVIDNVRIGGYIGSAEVTDSGSGTNAEFDVTNTGIVTADGKANKLYVSGGIGYLSAVKEVSGITNNGSVTVGAITSQTYAGGAVGYSSGNTVLKDVTSTGDVTVNGYANNMYVSGGVAYSSETALENVTNSGTIEVSQSAAIQENPEAIWLGGVAGYANVKAAYSTGENVSTYAKGIKECVNSGSIIYKGIARDGAYIGGVVAQAYKAPIVECQNLGAVISSGLGGDWASRVAEGSEAGRRYQQFLRKDLIIGGLVGETDSDIYQSVNEATVTHTCLPNPLKIDAWGETAPSRFDLGGLAGRVYTVDNTSAVNLTASHNKGEVTIYGEPYATTNTSSTDLTNGTGGRESQDIDDTSRTNTYVHYRVNAAGLVGRLLDDSEKNTKYYLTGCTNTANVSVPEAGAAKNFSIAGINGEIMVSHVKFSNCTNSGNITIEKAGVGTASATTAMFHTYFINMGGIAGTCFDYRWRHKSNSTKNTLDKETVLFENCVNSGNIHYGEVGASFYNTAGGILAQALHYSGDLGKDGSSTILYYCYKDIQFKNCSNEGDIDYKSTAMAVKYNYTYGGGIMGNCGETKGSRQQRFTSIDCTFDHCSNSGSVQFDRCNGLQSSNSAYNYSAVGGIVGFYCGGFGFGNGTGTWNTYGRPIGDSFNAKFISCRNSGRIWSFTGHVGGIIGQGHWFVKITGTADDPTINTGDIVVARNEAGNIRLQNWYGAKVIYAGGIAGTLHEYYTTTAHLGSNSSTNEGWPAYPLGSQYARIEYAVNEGNVGATGAAGGIVGNYRSLKMAAADKKVAHKGGIEFCRNTGNIYSLEGATSFVGNITGTSRTTTLTYNDSYPSDEATFVASKPWVVGVTNCEIGGQLLRGQQTYMTPDENSYQNCIYGEMWYEGNTSIVDGVPYDGCILYVAPTVDEPAEGENQGGDATVDTTAKR